MPYWLIWGTGWNALIRAAFTLLLSLQCDGQAQPLRLGGTCRGGDPSGPSSSLPNPCVLASLPRRPGTRSAARRAYVGGQSVALFVGLARQVAQRHGSALLDCAFESPHHLSFPRPEPGSPSCSPVRSGSTAARKTKRLPSTRNARTRPDARVPKDGGRVSTGRGAEAHTGNRATNRGPVAAGQSCCSASRRRPSGRSAVCRSGGMEHASPARVLVLHGVNERRPRDHGCGRAAGRAGAAYGRRGGPEGWIRPASNKTCHRAGELAIDWT